MIASVLLLAQLFAAPAPADWQAPAEHEHLVPRLSARTTRVFTNLRYEGNNRALRSPFEQHIEGTERVADVHDRIPGFLAALDDAPIERSRVVVFARPVFQAKGKTRKDLEAAATRAREQGVLHGVNMIGEALRSMMGWARASGSARPLGSAARVGRPRAPQSALPRAGAPARRSSTATPRTACGGSP